MVAIYNFTEHKSRIFKTNAFCNSLNIICMEAEDYDIVTGISVNILIQGVKEKIEAGFTPVGPVSFVLESSSDVYNKIWVQTMVKYKRSTLA